MILIKNICLMFVGLTAGVGVAGGIFAFITMIGIIPRLAARTNTAKHISLYETIIIVGGLTGNLVSIYKWNLPIGHLGMLIFGLFSGMFVGCLAVALAEVLDVIPIFARRINLTQGIPLVVLSLALGKALGALYQLVMK